MVDSKPEISSLSFLSVFVAVIFLLKSQILSVVAAEDGDAGSNRCHVEVGLSNFLPAPFNNLSRLACEPVWNSFVLRFIQDEDKVITIVLSAEYSTGWVGMAFSKDGMMVGSSAMVGWISGGQGSIKQYYLQGFTPSEVIANKGELQITNVPPAVVLHEGTIYLAFQLKLPALHNPQAILFAFGTKTPVLNQLSGHDDMTTIMFNFSTGSLSLGSKVLSTQNIGQIKGRHGALGITGWGVLLPAGAIIPRYFKHRDPLWYYLHSSIQFVGFFIGIATVGTGVALYNRLQIHIPAHRGIGISLLVLSMLQISALFLRPDKEAKNRRYWNMYHHWVGRLSLFLGALNIVLGIQIGREGYAWKLVYGVILAVILITVITLEALLWSRRPAKTHPATFQMNPVQ